MKTYIILIILGFTQIVIGFALSNVTFDDSFPVCPVNLFRRKRANAEYTRWRSNPETTPEFLVKVLDDELTTPITKQIVAVNIQPVIKGGEKIIVGGVIVPTVTTAEILPEESQDYTRFVPPTTTVLITMIDDDMYLAPQTPPRFDRIPPIRPKARHSERDESPPASPQFLTRATPMLLARQYAPITPVAFTRQTAFELKKPTPSYKNIDITNITPPTRTSLIDDIIWPKRTSLASDNFRDSFIDEDVSQIKISSTYADSGIITSTIEMPIDAEFVIPSHTFNDENKNSDNEVIEKSKVLEKTEQYFDSLYNTMFYADEDNESSNKKEEQFSLDANYEDKINTELDLSTEKDSDAMDLDPADITTPGTVFSSKHDDKNEINVTKIRPTTKVFVKKTATLPKNLKNNDRARQICNLIKLRQLNFNSPRTLPEIMFQLKEWAEKSPLVKWEDITDGNFTTMENPISLMIVDDPSSGQIISAKQTVMIVAGIQGRDHHAVSAAMYVLYQLIERSESHADLLSKYRFWIIPVFNPDGYDYSMTFPQRREWSKNLRQNWEVCRNRQSCSSCEKYGIRCTVQPCYGVNLDRNFEYQWIPTDELRAEHPCGSLYAGSRQLSELETRALTLFLHAKRTPLFTFLAFKEGEVLGIMYPYSHTRKLRAFDNVYRQRASRAASAAFSIGGRPYVAGQTSEFLPLYAGGIEDWVDGHLGIDNTYTIMMFRATDSYNTKLITERVVHEAYAAMDTLLLQSVEPLGPPPPLNLKRSISSSKRHSTQRRLVAFVLALHYRLLVTK